MSNIIAHLIPGDLFSKEGQYVESAERHMIQNFSYTLERRRDAFGNIAGPLMPCMCTVAIRTLENSSGKFLKEQLKSNESYAYTLLFNAEFDDKNKKLTKFDAGMVIWGYVVGIDEQYAVIETNEETISQQATFKYNTQNISSTTSKGLIMQAQIMVSQITYEGEILNQVVSMNNI